MNYHPPNFGAQTLRAMPTKAALRRAVAAGRAHRQRAKGWGPVRRALSNLMRLAERFERWAEQVTASW